MTRESSQEKLQFQKFLIPILRASTTYQNHMILYLISFKKELLLSGWEVRSTTLLQFLISGSVIKHAAYLRMLQPHTLLSTTHIWLSCAFSSHLTKLGQAALFLVAIPLRSVEVSASYLPQKCKMG